MATKQQELKDLYDGIGPLAKAADDEPVFVLVARDRTSSKTVRQWVENARGAGCQNEAKLEEALNLALAMDRWRAAHGGGKVPD